MTLRRRWQTMLGIAGWLGDRLAIDHQIRPPDDALSVAMIEHGRQRDLLPTFVSTSL